MTDSVEVMNLPKEEPVESSSSNEVISTSDMNNDLHDYKMAELVPKERRWIGTLVTKISDGERHVGNVVEFDEETGCFKIVYEDSEKQEEVCKEELRALVAPPKLVCDYLNRIQSRKNEKRKTKRDVATARASSTSTNRRLPRNSKEPKYKKTPSTYVPLAIKERKKDDYIWYY